MNAAAQLLSASDPARAAELQSISAAAQVLRLAPHNADKVRQYSEVISRQAQAKTAGLALVLDCWRQ